MLRQRVFATVSIVPVLLASSFSILSASVAQAATQRVVNLRWQAEGAAPPPYTAVLPPNSVNTIATFETANGAVPASPSIMWPANALSQVVILYQGGTITPNGATNPSTTFGGNYFSFKTTLANRNGAATLNPSAGPATTTVSWPSTTTICNNSCLPRYGSFMQAPLSGRRYGGTARLISIRNSVGLARAPLGGFNALAAIGSPTPMGTGPQLLGNHFLQTQINITNTLTLGTFQSDAQRLTGPYTTGMLQVFQNGGSFTTNFSRNGTWALNATGLTGMISLVSPIITQTFQKSGGSVLGNGPSQLAFITTLTVNVLPEPGQLVMLGAGLLALAAVYHRRRS